MRPAVAAVFATFTTTFEGRTSWFYLDVKGLVTTGVGNLCDPIAFAIGLPWQIGGYAATEQEIVAAWTLVKSRQDLKEAGGGAFASLTNLRLSDSAIDNLVASKAASNEIILRRYFPNYDDLPADAQLGILSMAWALGPAFSPGWPKFTAALNSGDFSTCAGECVIPSVGNPGLVPRNDANVALFESAASGADPDVVHWPPS